MFPFGNAPIPRSPERGKACPAWTRLLPASTFPKRRLCCLTAALPSATCSGGGVHRWSPDGSVETLLERRRGIGGMALTADGRLIVSGRDLALLDGGEARTLLEVDGASGFNDLGTDSHGRVYAGVLRFHPFKGEQPVPGGIWALGGDLSEPREVAREIDWANGMGFSPDGGTLYASDYAHSHVLAWDVKDDGGLSGQARVRRGPGGLVRRAGDGQRGRRAGGPRRGRDRPLPSRRDARRQDRGAGRLRHEPVLRRRGHARAVLHRQSPMAAVCCCAAAPTFRACRSHPRSCRAA